MLSPVCIKGPGPLTSQIRIGGSLQRPEAVSDHEDSSAEPPKGLVQQARPCYQSTDSVKAESPDEDGFVSKMSQDPVRMTERCQWIGTYSTLQLCITARLIRDVGEPKYAACSPLDRALEIPSVF